MEGQRGMTKADAVQLSFRQTEDWYVTRGGTESGEHRAASTMVLLGHPTVGPALYLSELSPGLEPPLTDAHGHASDNFRISLLGELPMGRRRYGPGEFRFQRGWQAYPSDGPAQGPNGGWSLVLMADRRGMRTRPVKERTNPTRTEQEVAAHFGLEGDFVSDSPLDTAGPSSLATTLGEPDGAGRLEGSYARAQQWSRVTTETRAVISLLGHPEMGPVLVLADTNAHATSLGAAVFDTDVLRVVVRGSATVDGEIMQAGEMTLLPAGSPSCAIVAGPHGLHELVVIGDRRYGLPRGAGGAEVSGWATSFSDTMHRLADHLDRG